MTDAWTDRKRRNVMNLCLNSSLGTVFLSSKECSLDSHTSEYTYEFVEHDIQQVRVKNVVQVVTDNASNNMGASKLLKEKRPTIFWTCCATHTINLMLQSIASPPTYKKVLDQAKIAKGKVAYSFILSMGFWQGVTECLKVFALLVLVRVFQLVDCDTKPSMGFVYGEIMKTKEEIKHALSDVSRNYKPIIEIIEAKMKDRIHTPRDGYLLNPYYHYKDPQLHLDKVVSDVVDFGDTLFFNDSEMQNKMLSEELSKYKRKEGMFGRNIEIKRYEVNDDNFQIKFSNL
ncbi:PREDICTED: uncharacterized protein LOC109162702 [Ipomoea nil]|uniref:uncharacterized protein LOC109162702 n=1 Tax=Ipomoea nil TaxID=35883 RepID=UPI000900EC7E|nr:PREDICTED: uncharacterized protein LOC109162702 [Ipomoea nil]